MANITGSLASVNSVPTEGTVLVRALTLRPGSTFAVTGEPKVAVIQAGHFVIEDVEPGPVQLTIQGNGVTHDVRVDVPDEDEVDFLDLLEDVYEWEPAQISAVKLAAREARKAADEAGRIASAFRGAEQLEGWADSASESAASALGSAGEAAGSAEAAAGSASEAAVSAGEAADSAGVATERAGAAEVSAVSAAGSAESAGAAAGRAESSAAEAAASESAAEASATSAGRSATEASAHADRAEGIVDSVSWDDDRLTVAGKTSPSLRGPKGDKGEPGEPGASTWDAISGKPETYPPEAHTHVMADITDLPSEYPPEPHTHDVGSIDGLGDELAEVRALAESRPAFFSGKGEPPSTIPGAVVGDYYLDETTMELHKITGV